MFLRSGIIIHLQNDLFIIIIKYLIVVRLFSALFGGELGGIDFLC